MKALIAKKKGMSFVLDAEGNVTPVTILEAGPCTVISHKEQARDGYEAIQIGYQDKKEKHIKKSETGHFKKSGQLPKKFLKEIKVDKASAFSLGTVLDVSLFAEGEIISVTGTSIGKGFQGNIKRNNFSGGPATHGSKFHRLPGSIGGHTFPARVWKGQRMHGQMGNYQITETHLKVMKIDKESNLIFVKGSVPGHKESILFVWSEADLKLTQSAEKAA